MSRIHIIATSDGNQPAHLVPQWKPTAPAACLQSKSWSFGGICVWPGGSRAAIAALRLMSSARALESVAPGASRAIAGSQCASRGAMVELVSNGRQSSAEEGNAKPAGITPTKQILEAIADISMKTKGGSAGANMVVTADAIVAATKGSMTEWNALDPSRDPATPIIKATASGGKVTFAWGAKTSDVKANPKDVLDYFVKDLAKMKGIEDASKARTIYDGSRIAALLQRAATNPLLTGSYTFQVDPQPTLAYIRLALKPKGGGGETVEALKQPNSAYIRLMRDVKADPSGVVLFQVMPDAFDAYLEARKVADEVGVSATWDFLAKLDITVNLTAYEIQRLEPAGTARPRPGGTAPVGIAPPKTTLD